MTAPHGVRAHAPQHIHPPKVELFDLDAMTNTDPKGIVRTVREYRVEPFGLYVARDVVDHPTIRALESWLLPEMGLRITDWFYPPGHEWDDHLYVDVVRIDVDGRCWRTEDHYLDLVVRTGYGVEVLDTDELLAAVAAGLLDRSAAQAALATTYQALDGLARHDYRLDRWLSTVGMWPTWSRH
jgi:predicted RNA-binding protein associated with RNAse of E/G family